MEQAKINQIYKYLESDDVIGERIGMQNVIYRLKMIYGDRFQFKLESAPGQGTSFEIRVPADDALEATS